MTRSTRLDGSLPISRAQALGEAAAGDCADGREGPAQRTPPGAIGRRVRCPIAPGGTGLTRGCIVFTFNTRYRETNRTLKWPQLKLLRAWGERMKHTLLAVLLCIAFAGIASGQTPPAAQLNACNAIRNFRAVYTPLVVRATNEKNPIRQQEMEAELRATRSRLTEPYYQALSPGMATDFVGTVKVLDAWGGNTIHMMITLCDEMVATITFARDLRWDNTATPLDDSARATLRDLSVGDKVLISGRLNGWKHDLNPCNTYAPSQCPPEHFVITASRISKI